MATPRKGIHLLATRQVQTAPDGDHSDGGNLLLRVRGVSASWVFRYTSPTGRRREMGLGPCERQNPALTGRSLTLARELAAAARADLAQGIDPIDKREALAAERAALEAATRAAKLAERSTLARVAREYHETAIEPERSKKYAAQWISDLERLMPPEIWHKPIAEIEAPELYDAMIQLFGQVPETASRMRQRLEAVFDEAEFRGLRAGNPAVAIRRRLGARAGRRERGSFAALPWRDVPAFLAQLREQPGIAAMALEFALLTAARTGEVLGATWDEIDLQAGLWTVPGARMKGGETHTVHLVPRAVEILQFAQRLDEPHVFPSTAKPRQPMSNMAMLTLLRRMKYDDRTTVHGLCRASFSTWANETAAARPDVIEACLAHREADRIRAAYNRAAFTAERKTLLTRWADYVEGRATESTAQVLEFKAA